MIRLNAIDALFLCLEDATVHEHTVKISILDYSQTPGGYSFAGIREVMRNRMHRVPPFRWRTVNTPLGLHHPLWIEDPNFDLDYHLLRVGVPPPGGPKEFAAIVAQISSRQLDRARPLWELWMVEGLENGRVAAVAKVHHTVADGVSSAELLDNFYDTSPDAPPVTPEPWTPERIPSKPMLVAKAIADVFRLWRNELPPLVRSWREARAKLKKSGIKAEDLPQPFIVPSVPFNAVVTPHRLFEFLTLSLDDAKAIRSALGGTINDVTLATASGALRRYLLRKNQLPKEPLIAGIPVSTRTPEHGTYGNQIAMILSLLRTDVEDPGERYAAVREAAAAAKQYLNAARGARLDDWLAMFPPIWEKVMYRGLMNKKRTGGPSMYSVTVSNVHGPDAPLYLGKARLHSFYSIGPIGEGIGLNITMWSYVNQMNFCLLGCKEAIPDLADLADDIRESFEELRKVAAARVSQAA